MMVCLASSCCHRRHRTDCYLRPPSLPHLLPPLLPPPRLPACRRPPVDGGQGRRVGLLPPCRQLLPMVLITAAGRGRQARLRPAKGRRSRSWLQGGQRSAPCLPWGIMQAPRHLQLHRSPHWCPSETSSSCKCGPEPQQRGQAAAMTMGSVGEARLPHRRARCVGRGAARCARRQEQHPADATEQRWPRSIPGCRDHHETSLIGDCCEVQPAAWSGLALPLCCHSSPLASLFCQSAIRKTTLRPIHTLA